jgi:three-Cys-motif partner protein
MSPKDIVWKLDDHTRGKHEVLRHYLAAWFPIMGSFAERVAFIDGFAGPGEYAGGEPGSPLIALQAFRQHASRLKGEAVFLFIEKDADRADHLQKLIQAQPRPANCRIEISRSDFEKRMTDVLDTIPRGSRLAPAFVMLDPFGISGAPMALVSRLLASGKAEIYISFMYEFIDRFKSTPEFEKPLTELYGTEDWRTGVDLEGTDKKDFFFGLYEAQLRKAGAQQVIRFDLYKKGRLFYALFFASKHWKGADVMKQALWKVAPFGDFAFRSAHYGQLTLGTVDYTPLQKLLQDRFRGHDWVTIEQVLEFVGSDQTDFHTRQAIKRAVLATLEKARLIEVDPKTRKQRGSFKKGTKLRFL